MKNQHTPLFLAISFIALSLSMIGCCRNLPDDLPKLYATNLMVTQDDNPLEGATVQLVPKDSESRWSATGVSDASGCAVLYTQGQYRGVPEGTYYVIVSKIVSEQSKYAGKMPGDSKEYAKWQQQLALERLKSFNTIDQKFSSRKSTPLEVQIGPKAVKYDVINVGQIVENEIKTPK